MRPSRWVLAACCLLAGPVDGQRRSLEGIVVDSTGSVVPYANVTYGSGSRVVASPEGRFTMRVDTAMLKRLDVRRIGYQPMSLTLDAWPDTGLRIVMAPLARSLSAVRIEADRVLSLAYHGFYQRMADVERGINRGFFVTPEEMETRPGSRITDFLEGRHGVRVEMVKEGGQKGRPGRTGLQPQGIDGCRMEIYIDGHRFYGLGRPDPWAMRGGDSFINEVVQVTDIAGIEVYPRSVQAPPKFQSLNGLCGVMLIWTR